MPDVKMVDRAARKYVRMREARRAAELSRDRERISAATAYEKAAADALKHAAWMTYGPDIT